MEADITQIKILLWLILGLQVFFVVSSVLCRIFGWGNSAKTNYGDLWDRGNFSEILEKSGKRLETHPRDVDALYFKARALVAMGLPEAATKAMTELVEVEPTLQEAVARWQSSLYESKEEDTDDEQ